MHTEPVGFGDPDGLSERVMPELFPEGVILLSREVLSREQRKEAYNTESATCVRVWMVVLSIQPQGCLEPKYREVSRPKN